MLEFLRLYSQAFYIQHVFWEVINSRWSLLFTFHQKRFVCSGKGHCCNEPHALNHQARKDGKSGQAREIELPTFHSSPCHNKAYLSSHFPFLEWWAQVSFPPPPYTLHSHSYGRLRKKQDDDLICCHNLPKLKKKKKKKIKLCNYVYSQSGQ